MKPSLTVLRTGISSFVCVAVLAACGQGFKSKNYTEAERDAYFKANPQLAHLDKRKKMQTDEQDGADVEQPPQRKNDSGSAAVGAKEAPAEAAAGKTMTETKTEAPAEESQSTETKTFLTESEALLQTKISSNQSLIKGIRPSIQQGSGTLSVSAEAVIDIEGSGQGAYLHIASAGDGRSVFFNSEHGKLDLPVAVKDGDGNPLMPLQAQVTASVACKIENCGEIILRIDFIGKKKQSAVILLGDESRVKEGEKFIVDTNLDIKGDKKTYEEAFFEAQALVPARKMTKEFEPAEQQQSKEPVNPELESTPKGDKAQAQPENIGAEQEPGETTATKTKKSDEQRPGAMKFEVGPNGQLRIPGQEPEQAPAVTEGPTITKFGPDGKPMKVIKYDTDGKVKTEESIGNEEKPQPAVPQSVPQGAEDVTFAPPAVDLSNVAEVIKEAETGIPSSIAAPAIVTKDNSAIVKSGGVAFNGAIVNQIDEQKRAELEGLRKAQETEKAVRAGTTWAFKGSTQQSVDDQQMTMAQALAKEKKMHASRTKSQSVARKNTAKTR